MASIKRLYFNATGVELQLTSADHKVHSGHANVSQRVTGDVCIVSPLRCVPAVVIDYHLFCM
jgi:hypothetical protein